MKIAGIDLGTSFKNESTGIVVAEKTEQKPVWTVGLVRSHYVRAGAQHDCNGKIAEAVKGADILAIDAPLLLASIKPWERALIACDGLDEAMVPSPTHQIIGHAWRAHALLQQVVGKAGPKVFEVFPASWFWLCEFDASVAWKGDATAAGRKRAWFETQVKGLAARGEQIKADVSSANKDEADALACVLCAILVAEKWKLERLDETLPPVLFPPRVLWDRQRLPQSVVGLGWREYEPR